MKRHWTMKTIIFRNEKNEMDTEYGQQGRQRLLLSVVEWAFSALRHTQHGYK